MIYHEGGRRYIPIKFSVRGRDLASAIQDLKQQLSDKVKLPGGYNYTWAGEFDSLQKEQRRLAYIIPVSLSVILVLLYIQFRTWKDAFIVMGTLPFAAIGGILALFFTRTSFSISLRSRRLHLAHRRSHTGRGCLFIWNTPGAARRGL